MRARELVARVLSGLAGRDEVTALRELLQGLAGRDELTGLRERLESVVTVDGLDVINGKKDVLIGKLQERYGMARQEAEHEADTWREAC